MLRYWFSFQRMKSNAAKISNEERIHFDIRFHLEASELRVFSCIIKVSPTCKFLHFLLLSEIDAKPFLEKLRALQWKKLPLTINHETECNRFSCNNIGTISFTHTINTSDLLLSFKLNSLSNSSTFQTNFSNTKMNFSSS